MAILRASASAAQPQAGHAPDGRSFESVGPLRGDQDDELERVVEGEAAPVRARCLGSSSASRLGQDGRRSLSGPDGASPVLYS